MQAQDISLDVLAEKYAKDGERSAADIQQRVARALAAVEPDPAAAQARFLEAMQRGFIPAGRIMSAAGSGIQATLINCFVQPVGDSVSEPVDDKPGIYRALAEAAETMRRGGGVGYDFSRIRPAGALVGATHSRASGPLSFMRVFDASCQTVESAGARRGAQMGVLRIDHPDIEAFIHAKGGGALRNFNLSVGVGDAFMQAVLDDAEVDLVHRARPGDEQIARGARQRDDGQWVYRRARARALWEQIMQCTYDHAEPGILFLDAANRDNNLQYCETFEATNPCAEEFLPDYGCCCLGSLDLTRFVIDPFEAGARFDMAGLREVAGTAVRMLDNVLDITFWPLPQQAAEARDKRRVGLGFLGLGDACIELGLRYDSAQARAFAAEMARNLRDAAYAASVELAREKGAFARFDADRYLAGGFASRLPQELRERIHAHGLRNSHLLAVAPTGTISLAFADNASNGIEPAFSWVYTRKKRMPDETTREYEVADHAWRLWRERGGDTARLPPAFVTALEMPAREHMQMLAAVQPFIDTGISKTVNVAEDYPFEDFQDLYLEAWKAGLKGLATYRPNTVLGSVLQVAPAAASAPEAPALPDIDPLTRRIEGRPGGDLQAVTSKVSYMTAEGGKTVYLSISFAEVEGLLDGQPIRIERPIEFFMPAGQRDEGQQWIASNMRLLSLVARSGGSIAKSLLNMRDVVWDKGPVRCGEVIKPDGSRAPRFHQSEVAAIAFALQEMLKRRGFLREDGREQALGLLAQRQSQPQALHIDLDKAEALPQLLSGGRICPECGGPYLRKVDGCERCDNCGYIGSCG